MYCDEEIPTFLSFEHAPRDGQPKESSVGSSRDTALSAAGCTSAQLNTIKKDSRSRIHIPDNKRGGILR